MTDDTFSLRRFRWALTALVLVVVGGAAAYHFWFGEDWVSSFYRAVVTVSLTGLDSRPPSHAAELFTIALLIAGVAIFLYVAGALVEIIARGVLTGVFAERRRRVAIESLRDHYIICGYGRVGRRVAAEFREAGVQYVVVDFHEDALAVAQERGDLFIEGNGTEDEDLAEAGLARARGLVASADSDVDNLYITLSARAQRPELLIVSRASDDDAAKKLRLAGADRVIQPYSTAGREMAKLVLKPQVAAFLDVVSQTGNPEMRFEEIEVTPGCPQAGRSIRDLRIRELTGAMIIALRKGDGSFDTTPSPEAVLEANDVLIAVGTPDEVRRLEELFAPAEASAV
jgi:voltage-gated potassium channel